MSDRSIRAQIAEEDAYKKVNDDATREEFKSLTGIDNKVVTDGSQGLLGIYGEFTAEKIKINKLENCLKSIAYTPIHLFKDNSPTYTMLLGIVSLAKETIKELNIKD